jgi:hypothetical protein
MLSSSVPLPVSAEPRRIALINRAAPSLLCFVGLTKACFIRFIDKRNHGRFRVAEFVENCRVPLAHALLGVRNKQDCFHLVDRVVRYFLHVFAEFVFRYRYTGRIEKYHLIVRFGENAGNLIPRGLRAVGHDRDLCRSVVEYCRFTTFGQR